MNRAERREFVKKAKKKGISKEAAESYLVLKELGVNKFNEGDKVRLNVARIKSHKDYEKMSPKYKEFIGLNQDTVFTVHVERETLVSLKEQPELLFWSGNLISMEGIM